MEDIKHVCPGCGQDYQEPGFCPGCQEPLVASCAACGNPVVGEQVILEE